MLMRQVSVTNELKVLLIGYSLIQRSIKLKSKQELLLPLFTDGYFSYSCHPKSLLLLNNWRKNTRQTGDHFNGMLVRITTVG